jgi:nicotinate dehydrogenase subunit B
MSEKQILEAALEAERCELIPTLDFRFEMDRREFFKTLGGGLLILVVLGEAAEAQESGGGRRRGFGGGGPPEIGAWLHIGEDGAVTVYTGKAELGQNARTSLTQVVAEELRAPLASIRVVMADTDLTSFDMGTFGSMTTPMMVPQLRRAAAAARELLLGLAAEQWQVDRASLVVKDGKVLHPPTKRALAFGPLAKGRRLMETIPADIALTPADRWKVAGKSIPKVNGREIVTGETLFASDIRRPGMLYGKVLRPSALNAALVSADTSKAEAMPGVTVVRDGDFLGVAAADTQIAGRALDAIQAEWKADPQPADRELFDLLKRTASGGQTNHAQGDVAEGMAAADKKLEQTYTVAYIAHTPLEPRAAVAEWKDGKLTVWTGSQRPFGVRSELMEAFRLPEDRVRVIVPPFGSGYGGKHTGEAAVEAARLAKAAGKPVKVVWTREEEFTWAYFRPAGVIEIKSGARDDGTITAWEFHNINSGPAAIRTSYDIPNQRIVFHGARSPLRQGSYRALAATANQFARETHMDELAHAVGMEPLAFRLKNLKDERFQAVLEAAAKQFGWNASRPATGQGFGIAGGFEKGGYVATCAEVAADRASGKVRVVRVVTAFDCGAVINPDHLRNQIEGCAMMGLGGALFEAIRFENGRILNARLSRYRVPRFGDMPAIETVLIDRKDVTPAGAGETPMVALAPAVGNALFQATGIRLRSLPLLPNGIRAEGAFSTGRT